MTNSSSDPNQICRQIRAKNVKFVQVLKNISIREVWGGGDAHTYQLYFHVTHYIIIPSQYYVYHNVACNAFIVKHRDKILRECGDDTVGGK